MRQVATLLSHSGGDFPFPATARLLSHFRCSRWAVCGRPSVGKDFFEALQSAGRGGHVSGLLMRLCHAPLAMMPFARIGSRPIGRARSATAHNGFSRSGGFNRLGASTLLCPFQHRRRASSAPKPYTVATNGSRYRSPLVISAQAIRAFLFASATAATLAGRRASS